MSDKDQDPQRSDIDAPAVGEAAEVAEATGAKTIQVGWNGRTWTVPASYMLLPAVAFRGLRRLGEAAEGITLDDLADAVDVLEDILGRAQFRAWSKGDRSSISDAFELVNAVVAAWGTTPGE